MSLNIKDETAVALITELAQRLGKTKTAVIRELAQEKLDDLKTLSPEAQREYDDVMDFLAREIWPHTRGAKPFTKEEEEVLLGYDELYK